ncbi:MAG TPA: septum formation initiator family protein [Vicinamibacterales bacterium]
MNGRWLIGGGLLVLAAYFAFFGGEYGLFELRRVRSELELERARLDDVRAEVARLEARVESLENDSLPIERIAREKWGMIRPGEKLYRFEDAAPDSAVADTTG